MTINDVDTALRFLGPADFGRVEPRGCLESLTLIIKSVAISILRVLNYICGDGQWHNNRTARHLIDLYIVQYNASQQGTPLYEKVCLLYRALLLRANGSESFAHGINIDFLQLERQTHYSHQPEEANDSPAELSADQRESSLEEIDVALSESNQIQPPLSLIEEAIPNPETHEDVHALSSAPSIAQIELENDLRMLIDRTLITALRHAEEANNFRIDCLLEIVKVQALIDIHQALQTADLIQYQSSCDNAYAAIASVQAQTNPESALALTNHIQFRNPRDDAFFSIAVALALTHPENARSTAARILDSAKKDAAYFQIAKMQGRTLPEEALTTANLIHRCYPYSKDGALFKIVNAQAPCNLDQALTIANQIQCDTLKAKAFCKIAKAQASSNPTQAQHLVQQALEIANDPKNNHDKDRILFEAARAQAVLNPSQAQATVHLIQDKFIQVKALCAVARAQAGRAPQLTNELITQASNTANRLNNGSLAHSKALKKIAVARALVTPNQELDLTGIDGRGLRRISKIQILTNPAQAIATAHLIRYEDHEKAQALCEIANSPLITNPEQVKDLFNQALAIAEDPSRAQKRCSIYCIVLQALAERLSNRSE